MDWHELGNASFSTDVTVVFTDFDNQINYYAPQIFKQIGLVGTSSGLFATGVYGK